MHLSPDLTFQIVLPRYTRHTRGRLVPALLLWSGILLRSAKLLLLLLLRSAKILPLLLLGCAKLLLLLLWSAKLLLLLLGCAKRLLLLLLLLWSAEMLLLLLHRSDCRERTVIHFHLCCQQPYLSPTPMSQHAS